MEETKNDQIIDILMVNMNTLSESITSILPENKVESHIKLEIEQAIKASQISILENLRKNFLGEYCDQLKKTVQHETLRNSLDLQSKLSRCEVPSFEDLNNLKTLKRAKIMIITKLDKLKISENQETESLQQTIQQMSDYIVSIDCQISQIVEKYSKKSQLEFEDQSQLKRPQISEYNPMTTPLKIEKVFLSFQNSHRMQQNQSHQEIQQTQLNQYQLGKQTEMKQPLKEGLLQKDDLISQSPLLKNDLDEDLRELIKNDTNNQELFNTNHQILKMKDLDETLLQEQDNQSFYQEQMLNLKMKQSKSILRLIKMNA